MPSPLAFTINTPKGPEVFYDPAPGKQAEVVKAITDRVTTRQSVPRNLFVWGNRGGGKSRLIRSVLHGLALAFPGFKYVVVRRNMPDLRKNHLIYLTREMGRLGGTWNSTHGIADYGNGSLGFYGQCEEEKDVEKVVGAEAAVLFVDEAPQIAWDWLRLMAPSLRVPSNDDGTPAKFRTMVIYGGNPIGESIEEIWKYFIDRDVDEFTDPEYDPHDFTAIELRLEDNPFLDKAEYRKQFAGIPAHYRAAWIDGVRMDARTLFDVQKTKDGKPWHYISELPHVAGVHLLRVPWIQVYRAFDMGYFPDPAVCVWLAVLGRRIIAVHEETWFRTIAKDLAAKIQDVTRELVGDTPCAMTYVDPDIAVKTGSDTVTVMDTLEMNGVPCEPSINDRVLYADAIHGLLGETIQEEVNGEIVTYPRFQVYEPGCPMLAKYLPKMRWDEKNERKMADHKFDHWIVALAYFAISSGILSLSERTVQEQRPYWMDWLNESKSKHRRVS